MTINRAGTSMLIDEKLATLLSYAKRGWKLLPIYEAPNGKCSCKKKSDCKEKGKHPRIIHGLKDASGDPAQIKDWYRKWPNANWALATGAASGVVAIDIDNDEQAQIALDGNLLPETLVSQTGRGFHCVYRHPGNGRIPSKLYSKTLGIDVKSDDGYIIIDPSAHANGTQYTWFDLDAVIAPLPDGLLEALEAKHRKLSGEVKTRGASDETAKTPSGGNRLADLHQNVRAATRKAASLPHSMEMEAEIRSALTFINAEDYDDWFKILLIVFRLEWGDIGKALAYEWSKTAPNFDEVAFEKKWTDAAKATTPDKRLTYGSLFMLARLAGWHPQHQETFNALADSGDVIDQLNTQYILVSKPAGIYRVKYSDYISNEQFLTQTANIPAQTEAGKPGRAGHVWLNHPRRRKAEGVVFEPGKPSITESNEINIWKDPKQEACEGDVGPFIELIQHLFKNDKVSVNQVLQFLAAPFQEPGLKIHYALLLYSKAQGTGKSMLAKIIGRLYGKHYTKITNAVLGDGFNDWIKAEQFVIGEEIALGDKRGIMSALKDYITEERVQVNTKNQPRVEMKNCANFIFLSNKPDALYLEDDDRRFLVIHTVEQPREPEFYKKVVSWLESGGYAHVLHLLLHYDLTGFNAKGHAPMTDDKLELITIGRSEVEQYIRDVIDGEGDKAREFNNRFHSLTKDGLVENAASAKASAEIKLKPLRSAAELLNEFSTTPHSRGTNRTALGRALASANVPGFQIAVNGKRDKYYAIGDVELWRGKSNEDWRRQIIRQTGTGPHIVAASRLYNLLKR